MATGSTTSDWPGERDPSHRDVVSANERPDPILLTNFKRALMSSDDALGSKKLMHMNLRDRESRSGAKYTYPLALLSRFPKLPSQDRIDHLYRSFAKGCLEHVFFKHFTASALARESVAPLRLGVACLASISMGGGVEEAETLFWAGASLWPVMVEIDNSLARSVEMLLAAVLLVPCGVLTTAQPPHTRATLLLHASSTIARRMRLQCPGELEPALRQRISSYSPMLWPLWLWDILHALHLNQPLNFSASEVLSSMPSSSIAFQDVYRDLVQESSGLDQPLLLTMGSVFSREDAFLLLLAILSDSITLRRSLGSITNLFSPAPLASYKHNPFVPFSAHAELERIQGQLSLALGRWHAKFAAFVSPDISTLYHYCMLFLSCPAMPGLYQAVQDEESGAGRIGKLQTSANVPISDESVNHAWALLDTAAACPKAQKTLHPAWMPIVLFQAALVVWAKISLDKTNVRGGVGHASIRVLLAFKVELEAMHWPCCTTMTATLQRLMSI